MMIICVCNNLSEKQIREAIEAGAENFDDVMKYHNVEGCCYSCEDSLNKLVTPNEVGSAAGSSNDL
jgi:bacterioferritin-associated ferredoxin